MGETERIGDAKCLEDDELPIIYLISDSVGATAKAVARAAAAQFGSTQPSMILLSKAKTFEEIEKFIEDNAAEHHELAGTRSMLVFYTIVDASLRARIAEFAAANPHLIMVDLLTPAVDALSTVTGRAPSEQPGGMYVADNSYFKRVEAVEFTISHDDGRNPEGLTKADIVLLGVSRSSKTPLSVYLSQQGYKVANVPLDLESDYPRQLEDVEPGRLFGLMTSPEVLCTIRRRRLGKAIAVASSYADPEYVYRDLEQARALMRRLGCIVVHTENRAVEETAQEILRYYEKSHPSSAPY